MKYSYGYASFLFQYCHLSGNSFFKILKSSSSKFLTNLSKLSDKKRQLSINLIQPYLTEIYSSFVLGIILNFTLSFFKSIYLSKNI